MKLRSPWNDLIIDVNIREFALPAILSTILFSAAAFLPPLGILLSIFCPIPIILAYLYNGQKIGILSLAVVALLLFLVTNFQNSVIFVVEYGLVAVVISESIRRKYSVDKVVLLSLSAFFLLGGSLIYLLILAKGINFSSFMGEEIKQAMAASIEHYRDRGFSSDNIDQIKLYSEKIALIFIRSIPAWLVVSSSMGILLNYVLVKIIWNKYLGACDYFKNEELEKWSVSDYFIWLIISSAIMLLVPLEGLNTIGLNLLIVSLLIFFYQGIAIVLFFMRKKTFPFFLRVIIYILIIIQPFLLLLVTFFGIFDIWIDFRKIKGDKIQI